MPRMEAVLTEFEPELFGKYVLVDQIAIGGMAQVYRAKTFSVGGFESLFVVKRILPRLGEDPEFVAMFVDEAKISVLLQHPNIVRVFDFGKVDEHFFIAMEHVEGRDLRFVMREARDAGRPMPVGAAAWVVSEASKGLHFAHTRTDPQGEPLGIVHRDVSPANLLLGIEGDVKVADFGIAKATSNLVVTDGSVIKGKYAYLSPEQATGAPVDARTDVFCLGVVLYELLTGKSPFKTDDDEETLRRLCAGDLVSPRLLNPELTEAVEAVMLQALATQPEARFATAQAFGEALREAVGASSEDAMRRDFVLWALPLLGDHVATDRLRVEAMSERAAALHAEGDGAPPAGHAARQGRLVGVLGVALLAAMVLMGLMVGLDRTQVEPPTVSVARTGALTFEVSPAATVYLEGRKVGEGAQVELGELSPGAYSFRLEATGHVPLEDEVRVTAGGVTRVSRTLEAGLGPDAPAITITSRPEGATVLIDGDAVGETPLVWRDGLLDQSYAVELTLAEHQPARLTLEGLQRRETRTVSRTLRSLAAVAAAEAAASQAATSGGTRSAADRPSSSDASGAGSLRVLLAGATWANVYVDGTKLPRTAPFSGVSIPAGTHTVRVENSAAGLEHTSQVTVTAGGTATVRALAR